MKKTFIFSVILFLFSCENQQVKINPTTEIKPPQIISIINKSIDKNPNWNQNDILRKNFNDSLKIELSEKIYDLQLLKEIPLKLSEISEYEKGKFAANFEHWTGLEEYKMGNRTYILNFNVIGLVPDSLINVLQDNKKYFINGKFLKFLGWDFKNYINGSVYTPLVGIEEENGRIKVSLGIILFDVISIQETN